MKTPRERLAELLGTGSTASFSAHLQAPAHFLHLEVAGVERVSLPVRAAQAKKLIAAARPAKFGRGTQTLTDQSVRDTWEITPSQVTLGGPGWQALLEKVLEHVRDELGLPRSQVLRAELHSMLVYGKGQFFLPHQDSEKHEAMLGTLVVSLPSAHTGGELVIEHANESRTYRASRDELSFVAFYADCRHQVTPVRSGHRLTLTFNLLADPETPVQATGPVTDLAECLSAHFSRAATERYSHRQLPPPKRLVYLLDHEYTQRGLGWGRLKGTDAGRAALLRAAADQAGCQAVLALAEVRETWEAWPADEDPWNHYDDYDGVEDEEAEEDGTTESDYELNDLIDDEITLDWWTAPDGTGGERISLPVPHSEACASTPSRDLTPYESEFEGYMGNYGNTLDRWYRRAAIVLWPRDQAFEARAEAGSRWTLTELESRIASGDLAGARAAADSIAPFWASTDMHGELLDAALHVAAGLQSADAATMLLSPFRVQMLAFDHAVPLAAVVDLYGTAWLRSVLSGWSLSRHPGAETAFGTWVEDLPRLGSALRESGVPQAAGMLVADVWDWLNARLHACAAIADPALRQPRLAELSLQLLRLLQAASPEETLRDAILAELLAFRDEALECLLPTLRAATELSAPARESAGLNAVARDCARRLDAFLARPPRHADDWSLAWNRGCPCELCGPLSEFLASRTQRTLEWPLAKERRRHIHGQLDSAALPVTHETRRQGRPYTLVLTKTQELFIREQQTRDRATADRTWLASAWT